MRQRATTAWMGVVAALGAFIVAASSDRFDLWNSMSPIASPVDRPVGGDGDVAIVAAPDSPPASSSLAGILLTIVLVVVILSLLTSTLRQSGFVARLARRRGWRYLAGADQTPMPDDGAPDDDVLDAARSALFEGAARNGIVECWMRLEDGARGAGLPRHDAETADEYSNRMRTIAPVDPRPLDELADLYREARFSDHPITEAKRQRALAALDRVMEPW